MQLRLTGSQAGRPYARRSQAEMVVGMLKQNLATACVCASRGDEKWN